MIAPVAQGPGWLPRNFRGYQRQWLGRDVMAGITLAAVAIPECMGYTKIVGTPVVTGLYSILLPLAVFAIVGSSRHLVVGADSATAAILFAGLAGYAQPFSPHWVALTSAAALLTAGFLLAAAILRLGFVADFLSRTVLVGFLSGVGVSVAIGQLPDMLGIPVTAPGALARLVALTAHASSAQPSIALMTAAVLGTMVGLRRATRRVPAPLAALSLAIAATWIFGLDRHGIAMIGRVQSGLPSLGVPRVSSQELGRLILTSASMFLVIVAQSAATARSFAQAHDEFLDENRDLLGLALSNAAAGLSGTFVVNGSPTKTAVAASAGARSPLTQLTTVAIVIAVLVTAAPVIERLPVAALASLVFLIGFELIDINALREIYRFRKVTFAVALATLAAVVWLGVERGIFVAIGLSVLDHLRQEYHPKDVVLVGLHTGRTPVRADPGVETAAGLVVYRFQAPLFFANADYFAGRVQALVHGAPHPVRWFVFDLISVDDIDYTGGLALTNQVSRLTRAGIVVAFAGAHDVMAELDRLGLVGSATLFESVESAVEAYSAVSGRDPRQLPRR
jgi:sulfate permease, SulP family